MRLRKFVDLVGKRFGRLVVVEMAPRLSAKNIRWKCRCDCGNFTVAQGGSLKNGTQQSCGCLQREAHTKHGLSETLEYVTWAQMKSRCLNVDHQSYASYGGRGITVCKRWLKFENFYADMGDKPPGSSLDRIDNNKGYSPSNCRWTGFEVQNNNRRTSRLIEYQGKTQSLTLWAREYGISPISLKSRLDLGWSIDKALTTPIDKRKATKSRKYKPPA